MFSESERELLLEILSGQQFILKQLASLRRHVDASKAREVNKLHIITVLRNEFCNIYVTVKKIYSDVNRVV